MAIIPRPSECIGVVGLAIAVVGIVVSLGMVLFWDIVPLGWYLLVASGTLWGISWLYCAGWEWEHFPFTRS